VHAVAADLPYTSPALSGAMVADDGPSRPALSEREHSVLTAWFESDSKKLVAERLHLSPKTVETYINRVRIKYANAGRPATSKAALVARALQDGLVTLDEL
ncbi:MAG: LuxR C-terminal-related transcriptional regulator, partial [Pseudonocardia sp.]|nr:LuxR C-terminal-related transcriptional regulator [Pseudonocardia sp.]